MRSGLATSSRLQPRDNGGPGEGIGELKGSFSIKTRAMVERASIRSEHLYRDGREQPKGSDQTPELKGAGEGTHHLTYQSPWPRSQFVSLETTQWEMT